jgi:DNA-binding MarR family transcriptional regulator
MASSSAQLPRVSHDDYVALAAFRHALLRFQHFSAAAAESEGLSPQQHQVLLAIKGAEKDQPVTIGALAENLFLRHHSTVGLIDRLAKKRLLKRSHRSGDRRKVYVELTPSGRALIDRLSASHRAELQKVGPELRRVLSKLSRSAEKH